MQKTVKKRVNATKTCKFSRKHFREFVSCVGMAVRPFRRVVGEAPAWPLLHSKNWNKKASFVDRSQGGRINTKFLPRSHCGTRWNPTEPSKTC